MCEKQYCNIQSQEQVSLGRVALFDGSGWIENLGMVGKGIKKQCLFFSSSKEQLTTCWYAAGQRRDNVKWNMGMKLESQKIFKACQAGTQNGNCVERSIERGRFHCLVG